MKRVLFVISLMLAFTYGQLLLAQNSNTSSNDGDGLETKDQQAKEAKALQEEKEPSGPKQEPASLNKEQKKTADSINKNQELSNEKGPSKVFIPTEEISEDQPVAFPVDI